MRKLLLALVICLAMTGIAFAELNVGDIPPLKQGIAYSLMENEVAYLSTVEAVRWNDLTLELGYSSTDKAVAVLSYQLIKLEDYVELPILDLLECNLGVYGGYGRIALGPGNAKGNNEWDYGVSATILNIKF